MVDLQDIARQALPSVSAAYAAYTELNGNDENALERMDIHLYVYADGTWLVDNSQYVASQNNLIASTLVSDYEAEDIAHELEESLEFYASEDS